MEIKLDIILVGRILAGVIILLAFLSAIIGAVSARDSQFYIFVSVLVTPLAWGFLILMITEIWREMRRDRGE